MHAQLLEAIGHDGAGGLGGVAAPHSAGKLAADLRLAFVNFLAADAALPMRRPPAFVTTAHWNLMRGCTCCCAMKLPINACTSCGVRCFHVL